MTPPPDPAPDDADLLADLLAAYDPARPGDTPAGWAALDPAARSRLESVRRVVDRLDHLAPRPVPLPPAFPFAFGRFRVRSQLGAGGCGVVFLADDPVLGRPVALKVPRPDVLARPELQRRFVREAQAAALLSHPNIVPVFEAGEIGGVCYTAAEYCPGVTLAGWLAAAPRPVPVRDAAGLVAALAGGMGYAHRRGVVHRDLKPSNVLMGNDERGTMNDESKTETGAGDRDSSFIVHRSSFLPRVTDFGFAKLLELDPAATQSGVVIGTPLYMAPEQAEGRAAAVGPPTDVYALGAILYELLAGTPPLAGASAADTLRRIVADTPVPVRAARPDVPRDLEAICRRCLAKDPAARYADGDALAADLGRFLAGLPTAARPVRWPERARMWAGRHPVAAALAAAAAGCLALLAAVGWAYQRDLSATNDALRAAVMRERDAAADLGREHQLAADRARALRRQAYLAEIREAAALADRGALTDRALGPWEPDGDDDLRGFEWRYLTRLARAVRTWPAHPGPVGVGRVTDDGRWAVTVAGPEVRVWDAAAGRPVAGWVHPTDLGDAAAVSADGRFVAVSLPDRAEGPLVAGRDGPGLRPVELPAEERFAHHFDFAGDHLLVYSGPAVHVFDPGTGRRLTSLALPGHKPRVVDAGLGRTAVVLYTPDPDDGGPYPVLRYHLPTGRVTGRWAVPIRPRNTTHSADGRHLLLTTEAADAVVVWDLTAGAERGQFRFPDGAAVSGVDRLADGRLAAVAWPDGTTGKREIDLAVWDPRDGRWTASRIVPPCLVRAVRVRPDGRGLLVGGLDSTVHAVDLDRPRAEAGWPVAAPFEAWAVAVSPDSRTIATGGDDGAVRLWDARTGAKLAERRDHGALVTAAAYAPDGAWLVTGGFDGRVVVRDPHSAAVVREMRHGPKVRAVAVSRDGRAVAAGGAGGVVTAWDADTGRPRFRTDELGTVVHGVGFTADGAAVLSAPAEVELLWGDALTGRRLRGAAVRLRPSCLTLSPDGKTLAVGYETGQVALLDAATGRERLRLTGPYSRLNGLAYSPDGKTLAAAASDGSVRLWQAATGAELFAIGRGGPRVNAVAFAPDGSFLAAVRHDGRLLLWPAADPPAAPR